MSNPAFPDLEQFYEGLKWIGQRVSYKKDLTLDGVARHLPAFDRESFGDNEYLDAIIRKPFGKDDRHIPVASVSKRYALIQHHEFLGWLKDGVERVGLKPESLPTELWMTDYGERIRLRFTASPKTFDPGDGFPMVLSAECFNSVDRSCALEIRMTWLRLVCTNGLTVQEKSSLRKVHDVVWMNRDDPAEFLSDQLARADQQFKTFRDWVAHPVALNRIEAWADEHVAKAWGIEVASRICHIVRTGYDGPVERPPEKISPHLRIVKSEMEVPGAARPAKNLFDVAQALSWVASRRESIEDQTDWVRTIPVLISQLTNGTKSS
jgi:hypothetical protein